MRYKVRVNKSSIIKNKQTKSNLPVLSIEDHSGKKLTKFNASSIETGIGYFRYDRGKDAGSSVWFETDTITVIK